MTLDEKIEQLKINTLTEARRQANEIIKDQDKSIDEIRSKHMLLNKRQSKSSIDAAKALAKQGESKALAKTYLNLRRDFTKKIKEYTDNIYNEVKDMFLKFRETPEYEDLLKKWIIEAKDFAEDEQFHIYLNPSDASKKEKLEKECGVTLLISAYDFIGGTRAVIRSRNILIDHAFASRLDAKIETFHFEKGELHE